MSPLRPDLVDCWIFRVVHSARDVPSTEVLLLRRAPGRILPGLWQCVSGSLEDGDRVAIAALRELDEETGFGPDVIEAFYDLVTAAVFAVRVLNDAEPTLSHEHDDARWVPVDEAHADVVWPGYRTAIERIRDDLIDPERAAWFELTFEGDRRPRKT
jgi:8-oxo-dGTP pyrophosphatase MutT (NUDIX family)